MNGGMFRLAGGRDPRYAGSLIPLSSPYKYQTLTDPPANPIPIGVIDTGLVVKDGVEPEWTSGRIHYSTPDDLDTIPTTQVGTAGHGTFVCALILNQAPDSVVHLKGVVDDTTEGKQEDANVAAAIDQLPADVKLINMSFSGLTTELNPPPEILKALDKLADDVVVVAAAGNEGLPLHTFPGCLKPRRATMVSVGAVDVPNSAGPAQPRIADFSNHWDGLSAFASGVNLKGPDPEDTAKSAARSGTSYAAALVTAEIAATAYTNDISVLEAANQLLASDEKITVYTFNGTHETPYIPSKAEVLSRDQARW